MAIGTCTTTPPRLSNNSIRARVSFCCAPALPGAEFFTRWITHLCAPTFVFLMGTSLAISVERRVVKGANPWDIDRGMLIRRLIIALLDLTVVSLGSAHWNFGVLYAIGTSMICMAPLRRLPTWALLVLDVGWMVLGELVTGWFWTPPGNSSIPAALTVATYGGDLLVVKYPVVPMVGNLDPGMGLRPSPHPLRRWLKYGFRKKCPLGLRRCQPDYLRLCARPERIRQHVPAPVW